MKHLDEAQLIDIAFGAPPDAHLDTCDACRERLATLHVGLHAVKQVKRDPVPLGPPVTARAIRMRRWRFAGWAAAAALVIASLSGLQVSLSAEGFSVKFATWGGESSSDEALQIRLQETENQIVKALELHAQVLQMQVDDRFNAIYAENAQQLKELSRQMENNLQSVDYQNGVMIASLRDDMHSFIEAERLKGKLP